MISKEAIVHHVTPFKLDNEFNLLELLSYK